MCVCFLFLESYQRVRSLEKNVTYGCQVPQYSIKSEADTNHHKNLSSIFYLMYNNFFLKEEKKATGTGSINNDIKLKKRLRVIVLKAFE